MPIQKLESTGWGRSVRSSSNEYQPTSLEELQEFVVSATGSRGLIARGMLRSYGDSALNAGGNTIDAGFLSTIDFHPDETTVTVGAGVSIKALEEAAIEHRLFPPVVPGTGYVSIGGAIAADIHGKSHHITGAFSSCVKRIKLLYSNGEVRDLFPDGPTSEHFWATVGGLGLTGMILEADLQLISLKAPSVVVEETRVNDLEEMLALLASSDETYQHTVAWIDLSGDYRGRGVVGRGNYATEIPVSESQTPKKKFAPALTFPNIGKLSLINRLSVRAFNEVWFRKPLVQGISSIPAFMHPLDQIQDWNRIYGSSGFIQYQFVVPRGNEDFLENVLATMRNLGAASFLGVLKKFGAGSPAHLSFPKPGWTLALDIPTTLPGLESALNSLDEELCERDGRIYLVKDARLKAEYLPRMYPRLEEWRAIRNNMDPRGMWQSDQSRRLKLC